MEHHPGLDLLGRCVARVDPKESIRIYREAHVLYPNDFWIAHNLGSTLRMLPDPPWEEITRVAAAALSIRPNAHAWTDLGHIYDLRKAWEEARSAFERAVTVDPRYERAWLGLAKAHEKLHRYGYS